MAKEKHIDIDLDNEKIKILRGLPGDKGKQGEQGSDGNKGNRGEQGEIGPRGFKGVGGIDGIDGKDVDQAEVDNMTLQINQNTNHREDPDKHFDNKKQKDKVIDHLDKDHKITVIGGGGGGTGDHGGLTGLSDDDHLQYLLIDGTRAMTGNLDVAGDTVLSSDLNVDGVTFTVNSVTKRIGMNTDSPAGPLEIVSEGTSIYPFYCTSYGDGVIPTPGFVGRGARGTKASPSPTLADDPLFLAAGRGYYTGAWETSSPAIMQMHAAEDHTNIAQGTYIIFKTTEIGSTGNVERLRIKDDGAIRSEGLLELHTPAGFNRAIKLGPFNLTNGNGGYIEFATSSSDGYGPQIGGIREGGGAGYLTFRTGTNSQVERMRIADNGDIDISEKLEVNGNININSNSSKLFLGANQDASIYFDGTDLNIESTNPSLLGIVKINDDVEIDGSLTMNSQNITDVGGLHFNRATELTISGGAVTATQGHHSIDTEADAANDDLDTINGGNAGEILLILPKDSSRTVRIRNGVGNIFLKHQVETKSYSFSSPAGSSGIFYSGGYYSWTATDANLTQASLSVTHSAVNSASACHIGIVAGGAGTVDTGVIKITVAGTTIDDNGNRLTAQTVILVADITTLSLNQYIETTEKWIGQVTIALAVASGSPVNYNVDFNYGCSKYEDFGNQAFTINVLEVVGLAGANDTGFNLRLFHHSSTGWAYAATGFVPGGTVLADMNSNYNTEKDLVNGESFAYKRVDLNTDINGDDSEGLVLEITTGANKAVEIMDMHFTVHTAPNFSYMSSTKQHLIFMEHAGKWLEL